MTDLFNNRSDSKVNIVVILSEVIESKLGD